MIENDATILEANQAAENLLESDGNLIGQNLKKIAPALCEPIEKKQYENISFGKYLLRCPSPQANDLPENSSLIVFRDASNDASRDILVHVLNQLNDSVIICDEKQRIFMINDSTAQMDTLVKNDVAGEKIEDVYHPRNSEELLIPQVMEKRKPLRNIRQYYTTKYGKDVDIVASSYPILQNGQLLGGCSIMEDWSKVSELNKQIIDLQGKLVSERGKKTSGKSALSAKYCFKDINYISSSMEKVVKLCKRVAKSDSSIMIYGETGTGKEMFAQSIHNASNRSKGPFLAINCAAIPENLLESMLFGTEKGAYTGAEHRVGLFEQADGGTLLLDEINSMNINLQAKLLRVLQENVIRRIGGTTDIQVDVRVISNINIPPYEALEKHCLRRDLYYRLGVVNIEIPPLRDRTEDIPLLSKNFILKFNRKLQKNVDDIDEATLKVFQKYEWPGNVRELQHAIEHAMNILPENEVKITPEYLPQHILTDKKKKEVSEKQHVKTSSLRSTVHEMEREEICNVLKDTKGNVSEAARRLQMSRQNLQYWIKRYQINVEEMRSKS